MMTTDTCAGCGTKVLPGARFCRQCGQPVQGAYPSSVTEGTTRILETPFAPGAQTNYMGPRTTGPTYLAPSETPGMQAQPNASPVRGGGQKQAIIIVTVIALIFVAIASLSLIMLLSRHTRVERVSTPSAPEASAPTVAPEVAPPEPPLPPEMPGGVTVGESSGIDSSLIYPGAETTMSLNRGPGASLLQLRTSDSFDQVVEWYRARLKPEKEMRTPGPAAIIKGGKATAIITGSGNQTTIMLKQEKE